MTEDTKIEELTKDVIDSLSEDDYGVLEEIDKAELAELGLTDSCSNGSGKCVRRSGSSRGLCYVCCDNKWYKFVDRNGNQYLCGVRAPYKCGSRVYRSSC